MVLLLASLLSGSVVMAEVEIAQPERSAPILVKAPSAIRWHQGAYEVWVLGGGCQIVQGNQQTTCREAVLWIDRAAQTDDSSSKVIAYLEGDVRLRQDGQGANVGLEDTTWLGRFYTTSTIQVSAPSVQTLQGQPPEIFSRGMARRMPGGPNAIRRTQYTQFDSAATPDFGPPVGTRRIRAFPRSNVPVQLNWSRDPATNQWIGTVTSGVNLIIDGLDDFGSIDVVTDRIVIWTVGVDELDLSGRQAQLEDLPLELYMEGNIVFREGERVLYADRMYYDVRNRTGIVLNAEMLMPVKDYQGLLRLRTQILQQTGKDRFFAKDGYVTSSRMGFPRYRVQVGEMFYEDIQRPMYDPVSGAPLLDAVTHEPAVDHQRLATGRNAFLYLGSVPIFYWPKLSTDLEDPSYYIRRVRLKNDSVFGTQIFTNWDGYQLLGIDRRPAGTDWDVSLDYLSERGVGHGTTFAYHRNNFFSIPGQTAGLIDYWGIEDHGHDNLGRGLRDLRPEKDYRYRLFGQHRQKLPYDLQLSAEVGWISDRNFLEQYFEREWDELKDETTGLELKQLNANRSWSITADYRINSFFTQTDWLPRADHFTLGQSLLGDVFTWHEHSQIGYGRYRILSAPEDPAQLAVFNPLPWEIAAKGERLVTSQEIDWPFQIGPVKTVPYAMGQLAHWGEDLTGEDQQRAYWQAGMRASMPMWRTNPFVEDTLWNVHGLAHKIVFDAEFSFAEANRDLTLFPLYDPINDDAIEAFERRFAFTTFGTNTTPVLPQYPARFDPRYYAVRTGLAGWVTSPSAEIAEDLIAMRMGMRHRWQTKRGRPGSRRIIDWMVLDTNAVWFPDASRDNFGKSLGLVDYDYRWHVGDRLTLVSDGIFDFFQDGQQVVTIGGFLSRPPRGNLYLGLRILEGPIDSQVLSMSYSYWMSPKWVSSFGMSVDLGEEGNIGERLTITRIGESLLVSAGFNIDASRGDVGAMLAIEPRFLPKTRLGRAGGARIPPAGALGLE